MPKSYKGYVAIITGSSRGIGAVIAHKMAALGMNIVVAAKSITAKPNLPGTIFTVAQELESKYGVQALPIQCNVRDLSQIKHLVDKTVERFGRIDVVVSNAGALWWKSMKDTPMSKYNLVHEVNSRASFALMKYSLDHVLKSPNGRMFVCSPPINLKQIPNKIAYMQSKFGMTMIAHGLGEELRQMKSSVTINAVWPVCLIKSFATMNFKIGNDKVWRKPDIIADTMIELLNDPYTNGKAILTEDYLRTRGYSDKDFIQYRCSRRHEPPRFAEITDWGSFGLVKEAKKKTLNLSFNKDGTQSEGPKSYLSQRFGATRVLHTDKALTIWLNRPKTKNAFSTLMYKECTQHLLYAQSNKKISHVILRGSGNNFSSGNDLLEWLSVLSNDERLRAMAGFTMEFLWVLLHFTKPIIAAVQGVAVGIGATILTHCDFVVCEKSSIFSTPFVHLGLVPENCSSILFRQRLGIYANELLYGGMVWNADRAKTAGLVNIVSENSQDFEQNLKELSDKLSNFSTTALKESKKLVQASDMVSLEAAWGRELMVFGQRLRSQEFRTAVLNFMKRKRNPKRARL